MLLRREAEPNEATIVNVLSACSSLCALSLGQWVHEYVSTRHDLMVDGNVGNALINMYAKCGNMGMAIQVFNMLMYKDIVSWSTIISGMAMNGLGVHALPLFSLMLIHGVPLDDVTFIGLISACSHGRMIDQGLMFFKAMTDVYRIEPQVQHYACIVDMYGRAGLLKEAEAFIKKMPVEADGTVWGALLNACRIHGNEEMFGRITHCLPITKGVSIGTYALLSNTYASSRRWEDANVVRDVMRSMGLKKKAGCSWIEADASIQRQKSWFVRRRVSPHAKVQMKCNSSKIQPKCSQSFVVQCLRLQENMGHLFARPKENKKGFKDVENVCGSPQTIVTLSASAKLHQKCHQDEKTVIALPRDLGASGIIMKVEKHMLTSWFIYSEEDVTK
ncbi:unnamed protein product [Camellia sinensis]